MRYMFFSCGKMIFNKLSKEVFGKEHICRVFYVKTHVFLFMFLLGIFAPSILSAKVWINELMQSNIDFLRDDLHEFPDSWMELYNDSNEAVNIQNWTVSDNSDYRKGWKISGAVIISPKSYLLIYADKVGTGLHADFRLDSGSGGAVYLFDAGGQQIDAVRNIPKQPAPNVAWGRITDGSASWVYFVSATPGATNTGKTSNTLLPSPVFSQTGGIFKSSVNVRLSLPSGTPKGVVESDIHYTLDNTEPTVYSPVYTKELTISRTTVVRAKLIHPDYLTNRSVVHSYIISVKELSLPVISISTDPDYLWDAKFGIYTEGDGTYGLTGNCRNDRVNWNNDWRRPINFEYFPLGSNSSVLNQLCETRIGGGCSRIHPQKLLIVYGNKRFGTKRFEYDLFSEKPHQEIKSFMIRNSGNDWEYTLFRDAAIQLFFGGKVDVDYQAYQPAIVYLNGEYWGIQNLRERSEEDFVLSNYGLDDTEVDVIGDWKASNLKAGDLVSWNQLMTELRKPASEQNYEWIMNQVDIDEFINYMILEIFVLNTDFPHNNVSMWRPRKPDGKWRFILKDLDFGLGIWGDGDQPPSRDALRYNTVDFDSSWEPAVESRRLLNALLTQDSFRKKFYGRFAVYMGDLLHINSTSQVIDSIQNMLETAMQDHLALWRPWKTPDIDAWHGQVATMKNWCAQRNAYVYTHLRDFFQLGTIMKLTFEKADDLNGTPAAFINGVRMRSFGLDASYFQKETVELQYSGNAPLYAWEMTQTVNGKTSVETISQQNVSCQIVDGCTSLNIKLVNAPVTEPPEPLTGVEHSENAGSTPKIYVSDYHLQISNVPNPSIISVFDVSGRLITRTSAVSSSVMIPVRQTGVYIVQIRNNTQTFMQKIVKP